MRTTVRTIACEDGVRSNLRTGGAEPGDRLTFAVANLGSDGGWSEAAAGCSYVLHGASPTPSGTYASDEEWIRPAVDGNLRVLRAAREAKVKRVVLTSAFGAIGVGHKPMKRPFNETDWSDLNGNVAPYQRSKTLSERAAWDFVAREGGGLELSAVNPVAVMGPVLGPDYSHSIRMIKNMMDGQPGNPKLNSCFVDVRDVADLHLRAMTNPAANGERFLATSGESLWMVQVAELLKRRMGKHAEEVSSRVLPNAFTRAAGLTSMTMKGIVPQLGANLNATGEKARRVLGWVPRPPAEAIVASAESLVRLGLLS